MSRDRVGIFGQYCPGLAYQHHQSGFSRKVIKPANVLHELSHRILERDPRNWGPMILYLPVVRLQLGKWARAVVGESLLEAKSPLPLLMFMDRHQNEPGNAGVDDKRERCLQALFQLK